jgi:hypothetical protein
MTSIKLTVHFRDPTLDSEEREEEAVKLFSELKNIDEVEAVNRIDDPIAPIGSKAAGGFLAGLLTAEVNSHNIKSVFRFFIDRLGGKPIELEVEANGRKLKVKANSRQELEAAVQSAQKFISDSGIQND